MLPVWRELLCDADTPVGAYARLRHLDPCTFLLESVVGGMRWARYSFIGVGARARVTGWWRAGRLDVALEPGDGFSRPSLPDDHDDGLDVVRGLMARYAAGPVEGLPRFWGGLVGVWGHDLVRVVEDLPPPQHGRDSDLPLFELLLTDTLVIFDNLALTVKIVSAAVPEEDGGLDEAHARAAARVARVVDALGSGTDRPTPISVGAAPDVRPRVAAAWAEGEPYPRKVEATKRHIESGDVFQLVLSQRFDAPAAGVDMLDVYRVLRFTNPAPYMYLLELPSGTLAGASPEVLVRVEPGEDPGDGHGSDGASGRRIVVRPIAGTRRRGRDEAEDRALEAELLADPKERAEHLMLIDLGRNDVGRVASSGSVRMEESYVVERYSRVMHIVSEVSGELRPELSALDALLATFPAGTLSGAPKVRALELLDELEPAPRGWYGGAVGYLGFDGGADFAICIRSVIEKAGTLRTQAGAGIVFDSDPDAEDDECHRKAAAVVAAIELARAAKATEAGTL